METIERWAGEMSAFVCPKRGNVLRRKDKEMVDQTLELVGVIEEQQALIIELIKLLPPSASSPELQEAIGRVVAKTEGMKANIVDLAEIEKWAKAREGGRVR